MRARLVAVLCVLSVLVVAVPARADDAANMVDTSLAITLTLNGSSLQFDVPPVQEKATGRVLVPMRRIFEALGATVGWNPDLAQVTATEGSISVQLTIGQKTAMVNGVAVTLDVAPLIIDGRTLVPLRFVAETLGGLVGWYPMTDASGSLRGATVTIDVLPGDPNAPATVLLRKAKQYKGDLQGDYNTVDTISVGANDTSPIQINLNGQVRGNDSAFNYSFQYGYINPVYKLRVTGNEMWVKGIADDQYKDVGYSATAMPDFAKGGVPTGLNPVDPLNGFLLAAITSLSMGGTTTLENTSYQEVAAALDPGQCQRVIQNWVGYLGFDLSRLTVDHGEAHTWIQPQTARTRKTVLTITGKAPDRTGAIQPFTLSMTADDAPNASPVTFPTVP